MGLTYIACDEVLVAPFSSENFSEGVVIGDRGDSIVRMIRRHNAPCISVNNGTLKGGHPATSR
jgi:hypothetical protein